MSLVDKMEALRNRANGVPIDEHLTGLAEMRKVFDAAGNAAFLSRSKLDLDTDGIDSPGLHYESTHQPQTSLDPSAHWLDSNGLNYFVLPGGFATPYHGTTRHGGVALGCLGTLVFGNAVAHAIFADTGPTAKYGEGSIRLHRALGFERVKPNGHIRDLRIEGNVWTLIYIGSRLAVPCTQAQIDAAAKPLFEAFIG